MRDKFLAPVSAPKAQSDAFIEPTPICTGTREGSVSAKGHGGVQATICLLAFSLSFGSRATLAASRTNWHLADDSC